MIIYLFLLITAVIIAIWFGKRSLAFTGIILTFIAAIAIALHHMTSTINIDL